ncbi:MAG TPA: hypothetical protein VGN09_14915 [Vicinamibacteria bacterium]|jgi:hypothetical protein
MIKVTVEYVGFRTSAKRREYLLRSHLGPEIHDYTVGITLADFAAGRARFQDGPEICYLKLMRELEAPEAKPGVDDFTITDAELAAYVTAHTTPARSRGGFSAGGAAAAAAAKVAAERAQPNRN